MSINIVTLIENSPSTKFTGSYDSALIEKIKTCFSEFEQQMFLSYYYCYLKNDPNNDFVIDLDDVWKWVGYNQKSNAKYIIEKFFVINKDYKITKYKDTNEKKENRGGYNKETIMLTLTAFNLFCMKSCTDKSDEIRMYFVKLQRLMFETMQTTNDELRCQVLQLENTNNNHTKNIQIQKALEREKTLLEKYATTGPLIYIIKVKTYDNGEYVVKIGHSQNGILQRYKDHKKNYDECLLLDCYPVLKSKNFEFFLHKHPSIYKNKVTNLPKHEKEFELFLVGKNLTYQMITNIINENIEEFAHTNKELMLENELLKSKLTVLENGLTNAVIANNVPINTYISTDFSTHIPPTNPDIQIKVDKLEDKVTSLEKQFEKQIEELTERVNQLSAPPPTKLVTGFNQQLATIGPRLQKINPDNLQLLKVYECVTEAMNENANIKRPSIMKAISENTVYRGFRWQLVERNADPNIIHHIEPTKETRSQNLGYVAKLNINKTEIVNVYLDRKTAAKHNGYESASALDNPVKNNTPTKGHFYALYENCDEELVEKYESIHGTPILYKNGIGQYDMDNKLICEHICKYNCIKDLTMSDKTLAKALEKNIPYNGHYFREIGSKLQHLPDN